MENYKVRVRKLLAQAEDQQGTPEGDAFLDKACELMARYGLEQSDVDKPIANEPLTVPLTGAYTDMQALLLASVARALHCEALCEGRPRSSKIDVVRVFGRSRHVERVGFLFPILRLAMQRCAADVWVPDGLVRARRSFMHGFAVAVGSRLACAEEHVARESPGYGIALLDDRATANQSLKEFIDRERLSTLPSRGSRRHDPDAFVAGLQAGERADIGHERIGGLWQLET